MFVFVCRRSNLGAVRYGMRVACTASRWATDRDCMGPKKEDASTGEGPAGDYQMQPTLFWT